VGPAVALTADDGSVANAARRLWLPGPGRFRLRQSKQRPRRAANQCVRRPGRRIVCALPILLLALAVAPQPAFCQTPSFDEQSLQALLQNNPATGRPVDSVEELVPLLPKELRSNFTLVYDSRSPFRDSISPDYPRVILFTGDARLVLTFTGDEAKPGANLLESLSFDADSARFRLRAYLLPAAERTGWKPSAEAANCARCHGADARPIFDSYPLWPGFYGSQQDTFPHDRLGDKEYRDYKNFLAGPAKSGVYRGLIFPAGSAASPYLDPRRFDPNMAEVPPEPLRFFPNTRLGMALTELNRQRIYRKLSAGKDFAANEKLLLAELLQCRSSRAPPTRMVKTIEARLNRENAARLARLGLHPGDPHPDRDDMPELQMATQLAQVVDVAAHAGIAMTDWSMALEPDSLSLFDGILSGMYGRRNYYLKEDLIYEMLAHLRVREPAFDRYFSAFNAYDGMGYAFGNRIDITKALGSCRLLRAADRPRDRVSAGELGSNSQ
jgi:cytochrome c553